MLEICVLRTIMAPGAWLSRVDSTIHWINYYPLNTSIGFPCTCPLHMDDDSSGRLYYPVFNNWGQDAIFTKGSHIFKSSENAGYLCKLISFKSCSFLVRFLKCSTPSFVNSWQLAISSNSILFGSHGYFCFYLHTAPQVSSFRYNY